MVWHKKIGPAQNNLGPVEGQGSSKLKNGLWEIVTKSQVDTKFNVSKSTLHCTYEVMFAIPRGTSILGEVRNSEISGITQ